MDFIIGYIVGATGMGVIPALLLVVGSVIVLGIIMSITGKDLS